MEGEEQRSETKGSFSQASIPKRLLIVGAGATVNILFGLIVYFILMSSTGNYVTNVVDKTIDGYAAQEIGLQKNDKIIEINGHKINNRYDINAIIEKNSDKEVQLKIERQGEIKEYTAKPTAVSSKYTGIYLDDKCKIVAVDKGSPAEKQGIQANDKLLEINNEKINGDTQKAIRKNSRKRARYNLTNSRKKWKRSKNRNLSRYTIHILYRSYFTTSRRYLDKSFNIWRN